MAISSAVYTTICFLPVSAIFAGRYNVSASKANPVSAICAAETCFCRQKANPDDNREAHILLVVSDSYAMRYDLVVTSIRSIMWIVMQR